MSQFICDRTFGNLLNTSPSSGSEFLVFAISIILLLGYVFFGGFRAVVYSDVWQMMAMRWSIFIAIISVVIYGYTSLHSQPN